jgi:hypothetical protein
MSRKYLLVALCALGACATQEASTETASTPPAGRDCFLSSNITTQRVIDDEHIGVRAGSRDYIITVRGNANDLKTGDPLVIDAHNGWICTGNGLGLNLSVADPLRPLFVTEIARAPETPPEAQPATPPAG